MINVDARVKSILIRIIAIAMMMEMLDMSILNTSLPQIARSFECNPVELKAALTVYLLSLGIFVPLSGWLADRIGENKALVLAITIFTISSLGCAFSFNLLMLVICRLLQGVGGAFLLPVGRLILARVFEKHEMLQAMARVSVAGLTGLILGPIIGGALTTYLDWRFIFIINLPLGFFGLYYIYWYVPRLEIRTYSPFDLKGFIYLGFAIGGLLFFLDILISPEFSYLMKIILFFIALAGSVAYIFHSRRVAFPLLHNAIFKNKEFMLISAASFLSRLTLATQPFLIAILLQTMYGFSAFQSGLFTLPQVVGALLSRKYIDFMTRKKSHKFLLVAMASASFIIFISFLIQVYWFMPLLFIAQLLIFGFPSAMLYTGLNSYAYLTMQEPYTSSASSFYSAVIQLSGSFGITLAAIVMIAVMGNSDLTHVVPASAFKAVFIVQPLYIIVALWIFTQLSYQFVSYRKT